MNESKEDALQAAMLAKFVGSQLGQIDSMSYDRNIQANRIDINQFISKVVSNETQNQNSTGLPQIPKGFAAPPPEDLIRQMVPDPQPRSFSNDQPKTVTSSNPDKVEKLLENIDKNLQLLISIIKNG